jgi:hypothetical protein
LTKIAFEAKLVDRAQSLTPVGSTLTGKDDGTNFDDVMAYFL